MPMRIVWLATCAAVRLNLTVVGLFTSRNSTAGNAVSALPTAKPPVQAALRTPDG